MKTLSELLAETGDHSEPLGRRGDIKRIFTRGRKADYYHLSDYKVTASLSAGVIYVTQCQQADIEQIGAQGMESALGIE